MNKRIKEIAEQAGLKVNADGEISAAFFGSVDAGYKKFAELIVKECAQVCRDQPNIYAMKLDRDNCAIAIEEHFGVEESTVDQQLRNRGTYFGNNP